MIIQLHESDVVKGIVLRLKELGIETDAVDISVDFTTSRKPRGITASVQLVPKQVNEAHSIEY